MNYQKKRRLLSVVSMLLSVVMLVGLIPSAAFAEAYSDTSGAWAITNDGDPNDHSSGNGEAVFGDTGFTYHSIGTQLDKGSSGGKDYVRSNNSNGSASDGIVNTTNSKVSWCDYTAPADGTLTVYVGNAATKTGYVSTADKNIGTYVPGGSDNYDAEGFKVTQGKSWATLDIEVEKGVKYFVNLTGSKMLCYGIDFVPYREVKGSITDSTGEFKEQSYTIKFTEKNTRKVTKVEITGTSYSVFLKPGEYTIGFDGTLAQSFAFSNASRNITVSAGEGAQAGDLTVEKSLSYNISGDILGLPEDYDTADLRLVFVPEDTANYDNVEAEINKPEATETETSSEAESETASETTSESASETPSEPSSEETPDVLAEAVGTDGINFVAGVDTLNYSKAGFKLESGSVSAERDSNIVYTSIDGSSIKASDVGKSYVYAFTITGIPSADTEITATPYVIGLDGNTVYYKPITCSFASLSGKAEQVPEAKTVSAKPMAIAETDGGSDSTADGTDADVEGLRYSALLMTGVKYTLVVYGAKDYKLKNEVTAKYDTQEPVDQPVEFIPVETYAVSGGFLGLTQVRGEYEKLTDVSGELTFENVDDGYTYKGTIADGKYTASLRDGSYKASLVSDKYSTSTHVTVSGAASQRDLLLKDISAKTVEYKAELLVGQDKEYKSVQSAVDAATAMTRSNGERVTIKLDPGVYREQVVINTPNITIESNGGSRDDTKITWYYGIGYKYYSCVNSYYDPYADYDKFEKGNAVSYWGSAVITNAAATGFRAQNVTFENSFNKYMTDEEMTDGVEPNGLESINVQRKENTDVDTRAATERAAALVNYADKIEFKDCSFLGSQDTLYTTNRNGHMSYYKNCYIEGQTDFIYGNGDVIFDACEINFCGYDGTEAAGYLTANSNSQAYNTKFGYIFRSCYVSYNAERDTTPGYFGRMWGDSAKVAFINTQLQEPDMIVAEGWTEMLKNQPTSPNMTLVEYNTTYNGEKVDTTKRVAGVKDSIDPAEYSVETAFTANGWTPYFYTPETASKVEFINKPAFTSNGDLNIPNPGMKITTNYDINVNNDASIISYYAVDTDADMTSLETILKSATLLKSCSAAAVNTFQIPMECAGKYIMAVVTPMSVSGLKGDPEYVIEKQAPVSDTWYDPDNPESIAPGSGINIYLMGDSTVQDYTGRSEGAWGEFLQDFFIDEDHVKVLNHAIGGRSVRNFLNEGRFDKILETIKEGDYLFIQFGHNDCANEENYYADRFVPLFTKDTPEANKQANFPTIQPTDDLKKDGKFTWDCGATYKGFIQYYIDKALEKGAVPVVVSPVSRLYYQSDGTIRTHHDAGTKYAPTAGYATSNDAYVRACKEIADANADKGVLYFDNFAATKALYEEAYKACGSNVNGYALMSGGTDSTHNNKTGGVILAGLVAKWIQDADIAPSKYVVQPETVYGENPDGKYIFEIKNGKFTARNVKYEEVPYWSQVGQELFDSLSGSVKNVTLNFASDEALKLYVTDAETTFTDGVYSGIYKNESGQRYNVNVYSAGIQYYNNDIRYGTKANAGKAIFSFDAAEPGIYTVNVTANTGDGTATLYKDSALSESVASSAVSNSAPGSIVYTKTAEGSETLYFAASVSNNLYLSEMTISKEEIPVEKPNEILLNFATDEALALYETNADAAFGEEGVYSGVYTNADGKEFEASVYKTGVQYYNSDIRYGTKVMPNKPVFSFVADKAATYTVTADSNASGSDTFGIYKDAAMTQPAATAKLTDKKAVYDKSDDTAETLYVGSTDAGNVYAKEFTISYFVPIAISLDFELEDTMKLYESADTYTDGVASGKYTNAEGQSFDVSIYQSGIQYYNHDAHYGTKADKLVFSFVTDEAAMYTLNFTTGTGSATINLYSDPDCTQSVASAAQSDPLVYKKKTSEPETLYVSTTNFNNYYMATASIKKEALPDDVKINFKGKVDGIEPDDSNVVLTFKGATENFEISASDYQSKGHELIVGETYIITAKGDKGVYTGTDIVTDDSGEADIVLSRLGLEFPLNFKENYADYQTFLTAMGYSGSKEVTDVYSGITVHPNGVVIADNLVGQYGAKTNANDIISFIADRDGTVSVTVSVTAANNDTLVLKVNDEIQGEEVTASGDTVISADVKEGDKVTIHTPTRANLYYSAIAVDYSSPATASVYEDNSQPVLTAEAIEPEESVEVVEQPEEESDNASEDTAVTEAPSEPSAEAQI